MNCCLGCWNEREDLKLSEDDVTLTRKRRPCSECGEYRHLIMTARPCLLDRMWNHRRRKKRSKHNHKKTPVLP